MCVCVYVWPHLPHFPVSESYKPYKPCMQCCNNMPVPFPCRVLFFNNVSYNIITYKYFLWLFVAILYCGSSSLAEVGTKSGSLSFNWKLLCRKCNVRKDEEIKCMSVSVNFLEQFSGCSLSVFLFSIFFYLHEKWW